MTRENFSKEVTLNLKLNDEEKPETIRRGGKNQCSSSKANMSYLMFEKQKESQGG